MVTDELTPRERDTLELLRLGLTNEEIAERLGITLDGAKYHVSSILSKLGVSSREEAVMAETPPRQRTAWQAWPIALKFALFATSTVLLAGVGLLAFSVLRTPDGSEESSLTVNSDDPLAIADYVPGDAPHILDHWHASYIIFIGDEKQPNAPTWESGIHTHGDGIMHMHPFTHEEEGRGAALNKWFEYGGGELTETSMREPGFSATVHAGDAVPGDGRPGQVYVMVNGQRVPPEYIPRDGDQVLIYSASEAAMREKSRHERRRPPGGGTATPPVSGTAPP